MARNEVTSQLAQKHASLARDWPSQCDVHVRSTDMKYDQMLLVVILLMWLMWLHVLSWLWSHNCNIGYKQIMPAHTEEYSHLSNHSCLLLLLCFDIVPDRSISIQLQNLRSEWNIVIFWMECLKSYSKTTLLLCLSFQKQPVFFGLSLPSLLFPAPLPLSALCRCGKTSQLSDRRFGRLTDEHPCGHHMTWDEVTWEIATTKWWWRQSVTEEVFNIFSRGRWMKVSSNQSYCLRQSKDLQDDIFRCFMVLSPSCPCRQQDGRIIPDNCHFFTLTQFLENKIYTEIYTVNCQFFALNL